MSSSRESEEWARQRAVAVAEGAIAGDIGIIAACRLLRQLGDALVGDGRNDPDFLLFIAVDSETDSLPLEDQRANWDESAFESKQTEVSHYEADIREEVLKACRSLVERFRGV